jgi:3D (Asp-Asp-Asp) domain-containing protein
MGSMMANAIIANGNTNSIDGSIVDVAVGELICNLEIEKNIYFDTLPIIPENARVKGDKYILYRLKVRARLVHHSTGKNVGNHNLQVCSSRQKDNLFFSGKTDHAGNMIIVLETYEPGTLELSVSTPSVTSPKFKIFLKDAWYESLFLVTGYHVCHEDDFNGPLVAGAGLNEKHKDDFLYSARGVPMQGTGLDTEGRYIRLRSMGGGWLRNSRGRADRVSSPENTTFDYAQGVLGRFGTVRENRSIAIDPHIIPSRARVEIEGIGERCADDTGSQIRLYHVDNFLGAGRAVVSAWLRSGVNGTRRKVKFIGW